jgi:uncharacterized damage-inducible protein DinB
MAHNNLWSNHRLHGACGRLPLEEYFRDRGAFFRSIHGTLNHILLVDRYYLAALRGERPQARPHDYELYRERADLTKWQEANDRELIAYCDVLTPQSVSSTCRWTDSDGDTCEDPVHGVLAHLFLHQIHHRGQVHNMLSTAGTRPPQLDEFFPSRDAPLRERELRELGLEL